MVDYRECCQQYDEPGLAFLVHWEPLRVRATQREDVARLDVVVVVLTDDAREVEDVFEVGDVAIGVVVLVVGREADVVDVSGVMVAAAACCCEEPSL